MKQSIQELLESELPEVDFPDFQPGDTIRVHTEEEIGGQMRDRKFEGVCIGRSGSGTNETFKVRKVSFGVGVERIFPLHSPIIEDVELVRKGKVRRAKLNYLEGRSTKNARIQERRRNAPDEPEAEGAAPSEGEESEPASDADSTQSEE